MHIIELFEQGIVTQVLPPLLIIGLIIIVGFYFGQGVKYTFLPSIIGFMLLGLMIGPSFINIVTENLQNQFSFITQIALGFVALSIGLELKISSLKSIGFGVITVIFTESLLAFFTVFFILYFFTNNLALSLIFAAMAPASAPAGTVAIIREYNAKGPLTKTLYAVVGFDDGLAIIIFGIAAAIAKSVLLEQTTVVNMSLWAIISPSLIEIGFSFLIGILVAIVFCILAKNMKGKHNFVILIFGFILVTTGLCEIFHSSLILTNMILGFFIVNTQKNFLTQQITEHSGIFMPVLFVMFFVLAGAHLKISALPSLGILGILYIAGRTIGLISGASIGAWLGKLSPNIKKYLGLGILSQAGVAIGLSLIVKHDFAGIGKTIIFNNQNIKMGDWIGETVLTTITATCIFFEIIGPITTKIALTKAGEINS